MPGTHQRHVLTLWGSTSYQEPEDADTHVSHMETGLYRMTLHINNLGRKVAIQSVSMSHQSINHQKRVVLFFTAFIVYTGTLDLEQIPGRVQPEGDDNGFTVRVRV